MGKSFFNSPPGSHPPLPGNLTEITATHSNAGLASESFRVASGNDGMVLPNVRTETEKTKDKR